MFYSTPHACERRAAVARGKDLWLRRLPLELRDAAVETPTAASRLFTALYCSNLLENPHLHRV